ncbi:MAG TPA: DNA polymerase III subunit delta [Thermodesulfobacteriota bacterium]|nr:DNA polymerase III subunit delta [Thermodesulfobacteriota bacterium]
MTVEEFEARVARGRLPPVVLLVGEEQRLAERAIVRLRERLLDEGTRAFNEERFRGDEVEPVRLADSLRTLPLLGGRRLVIVREADRLSAEALALLAAYARAPVDSTLLVLAAEKPDRRLGGWKALEAAAAVVDCRRPEGSALRRRLEEAAQAAGVRLTPEGAELLLELAGHDLGVLEGELAKLAAFAGPDEPVGPETVVEVVSGRGPDEPPVFAWVDAVFERRVDAALAGLRRLLAAGVQPLALLALLARQLRLLWSARALAARGAGVQEIGERLLPRARFLAPRLLAQARGFTEAELARAHEALVAADLALKSSPVSDALVLERLVLALCGAGGRGGRPGKTGS